MDQGLKQRVVGAAVLMALGVIFIPLLLDQQTPDPVIEAPRPTITQPDIDFNSRIEPIDDETLAALDQEFEQHYERAEDTLSPVVSTAPEQTQSQATITQASEADADETQPQSTSDNEATDAKPRTGLTAWVVQLGSFSSQKNAEALVEKLKKKKYPAYIEVIEENGTKAFRVRVGPQIAREGAQKIRDELYKEVDLKGMVIRYP